MKKIITLFLIMFSFFTKGNAQYDQLASDFSFKDTEGKTINLANYKDKVIVVVNVSLAPNNVVLLIAVRVNDLPLTV